MKASKPVSVLLAICILIVLLGSLLARFYSGWPQVLYEVVWGWTEFLSRVIPQVHVRWDGVLLFVIGSVLFGIAFHWIAGWIYRHRQTELVSDRQTELPSANEAESADTRKWKVKWTFVLVVSIELLFVAGVSATGVTHQLGWMMSDDRPLFGKATSIGTDSVIRVQTANQMKMEALACSNVHATHKRFPSNTKNLGWTTETLSYGTYGYYDEIDREQAWNSEHNSRLSKKIHPAFINPRMVTDKFRDANGYGLSHFPGNANVFDRKKPLRESQLVSAESTLLFAEKGSDFSPWASPENVRDVTAPINSPAGFGEVKKGEIIAAFADGSIRFISTDVDPEVFRSFAGPKE